MTRVVLVHGEEQLLCDEYVESLLPQDRISVEIFDMETTSISNVLLEAAQGSLFGGDEKIIILKDCNFLSSTNSLTEKESNELLEFINDQGNSTTLIFKLNKLDKRKKLVKTILKSAEVFEGKPMRNPQKWLLNRAKKYGFTLVNGAAEKMVLDLGTDLYLLDSELKKIKNRYPNERQISAEMLEDVLSRTLESDVFKLINCIMDRNPAAIDIFNDLILTGSDEIQILLLIARQFRMIEQIKLSEITGVPVEEFLNVHPFALQMAREQANDYSLEEVQEKMRQLSILDLKLKRGQVDKTIALETLILGWM